MSSKICLQRCADRGRKICTRWLVQLPVKGSTTQWAQLVCEIRLSQKKEGEKWFQSLGASILDKHTLDIHTHRPMGRSWRAFDSVKRKARIWPPPFNRRQTTKWHTPVSFLTFHLVSSVRVIISQIFLLTSSIVALSLSLSLFTCLKFEFCLTNSFPQTGKSFSIDYILSLTWFGVLWYVTVLLFLFNKPIRVPKGWGQLDRLCNR